MQNEDNNSAVEMTGRVVSSYVSNNVLPRLEVAVLIRETHAAFAGLYGTPVPSSTDNAVKQATKAEIAASITDASLISFEDGKPYKTLRRHLTLRNLSPAQYRAKWGLPDDYPMTSPSYSRSRSELARAAGLGRGGRAAETATEGQEASA